MGHVCGRTDRLGDLPTGEIQRVAFDNVATTGGGKGDAICGDGLAQSDGAGGTFEDGVFAAHEGLVIGSAGRSGPHFVIGRVPSDGTCGELVLCQHYGGIEGERGERRKCCLTGFHYTLKNGVSWEKNGVPGTVSK